MAVGAGELRIPIVDVKGVVGVPSTFIDSILAEGMIVEESGTRFEGPHADVDEPTP